MKGLAFLLLWATAVHAADLLSIHSAPGDFIGQAQIWSVGSEAATFSGTVEGGTVSATVRLASGSMWFLRFNGLTAAPPEPGHHAGIPGFGGPDISGDGRGCSVSSGSYELRALAFDQSGFVQELAVDFLQYCNRNAAPLAGSLRFRAGDAACGLDGADCDDLDPCTRDDRCLGGVCRGTTVACSDGDACTASDQCDPADGVCHGGARFDCSDGNPCNGVETCDSASGACVAGAPVLCDDGDACNGTEECNPYLGTCVAGTPLACDDGNPCTADACAPATGCVYDRGACWLLAGRQRVTACYEGRCAARSAAFNGYVVLFPDGRYRVPSLGGCTSTSPVFPDEVGRWSETRPGRLQLVPANLQALVDAQNACLSGARIKVLHFNEWLRLADDQRTLVGNTSWQGRARTRGLQLPLATVQHYRGRRIE